MNTQELIAQARARRNKSAYTITNKYGEAITLNKEQTKFVDLALQGNSMCLLGAAGTGKTTVIKAFIQHLVAKGCRRLVSNGHSKLTVSGTPAIVACAFTRTATNNIKQALSSDMQNNTVTIHSLVEYAPTTEEYEDQYGMIQTRKVFKPRRDQSNPLDQSIQVLLIEEASMLSTDLYKIILEALSHDIQIIFIGDINQLPPVFGSAILGYAMLAVPTVELTEVYRNAGAIIQFAHRILSGKPIPFRDFKDYEIDNKVILQTWNKAYDKDIAVRAASTLITTLIDTGDHDPLQDIVLCPFNVSFGTDALNAVIANHVSVNAEQETHEVISGFDKKYLAVGDRVLYRKERGTIVKISKNLAYLGKQCQPASVHLDRYGCNQKPETISKSLDLSSHEDIDTLLDSLGSIGGSDELSVRQCSHLIDVKMDTYQDQEERIVTVAKTAQMSELILAYAVTVHKAQGSEWRKVRLLLHPSHASMLTRELLYTAVTRAKETVHILCAKDALVASILRQAIPGNTLEEKAEVFKGKVAEGGEDGLRFY